MALGRDPIPPSPCDWTKDQYHQIYEMNWFIGKHVELIGGEMIEEGRMTQRHWGAVNLAVNLMPTLFQGGYCLCARSNQHGA